MIREHCGDSGGEASENLGNGLVWNAWTAERLMDIPATGGRRMPTLSADGKRFPYVDTNGLAQVFEPFTSPGKPLATLRAEAPIVAAVLSPAAGPGLKAATRLADGTVQFWDTGSSTTLGQPLAGSSTNGGLDQRLTGVVERRVIHQVLA